MNPPRLWSFVAAALLTLSAANAQQVADPDFAPPIDKPEGSATVARCS